MSLQTYLQRQFEHDYWANRQEIDVFFALEKPPSPALKLLGHIVAVEWLWLDRLQGTPQRIAVWPELPLADCDAQLLQLKEAWQSYLSGLSEEDLAQPCRYINSKGESWENNVIDILAQVIQHSSHHRGQIALELRKNGNIPVPVDYIHAVREGLLP